MGRVVTNNVSLQYAIEDTENNIDNVGLLPGESGIAGSPSWVSLQPNTLGNISPEITTVARDPISPDRQRRKGAISDLDAAAEFEVDLTISHFNDFAEGFAFSRYIGAEVFNPSSVDVDSYTVTAGSALTEGTLIYGRGFTSSANNGLKEVGSGSTTTDIVVTDTLTVEAAPPSSATIEVAGFRSAAGDLDVTAVNANQVTITSAANIFSSNGLDLQPGAEIFFGGEAAINKFSTANNSGYARIVSVATDGSQIIIDKTGQTWALETNTAQEVDIYVGRFLKNVPTNDPNFIERSFQFELSYPNLATTGGGTEYEYSRGNYCNTIAINFPLTDKATIGLNFVGLDTDPPTATRKANAATPVEPTRTGAVSTTADFSRLRVTEVDETGLTTDFKSLTVNLNNNVSPEKVLNVLGARFINYGNLEVSMEMQLLFTEGRVVDAIRNNTTLSMDFGVKNDDGAIFFDVPSLTLGGGGKDFPVDETVLINLTADSFRDSTLGTSFGITTFAFIP